MLTLVLTSSQRHVSAKTHIFEQKKRRDELKVANLVFGAQLTETAKKEFDLHVRLAEAKKENTALSSRLMKVER